MIPGSFSKTAENFPTIHFQDNGVPVSYILSSGSPTASVLVSFRSGVAHEEPRDWGISHFIEHMVFRGSRKFPTLYEISRAAERMGGRISAFSTRNMISFWIKTPPGHEEEIFSILDDLLFHSEFRSEFIVKEKEIIKQEIFREINNTSLYNSLLMEEILLSPSPSSRHPIGVESNISEFNSSRLFDYINSNFNRSSLFISASGNLSTTFKKHLNSFLEGVPSGVAPAKASFKMENKYRNNNTFIHKSHHKNQAFITIGWKLPEELDSRIIAFRLLNSLLGSGYTSLLNRMLREEKNLTYLCTTQLNCYDKESVYKINLSVSDANALNAISLIHEIINNISTGNIDMDSFNEAVIKHCSHILFKLEDSLEAAKMLSSEYGRNNMPFSLKKYFNDISKINPDQISEIANIYLNSNSSKTLIQTGSESLIKALPNAFIMNS